MYSQANVRAGKVLRPPTQRCRPWTPKVVCGTRMGELNELSYGVDAHFGWKGDRPVGRLDVGRVRSKSEDHKRHFRELHLPSSL